MTQTTALTLVAGLALGHAAQADQVIIDDLIVQGSICAGFDCVNGESFGFDTIRMKENNLRLHFDDTSTSASFPSNDWRITANESDNGGENRFSIDDATGGRTPFTIRAGAPNHSLYVDAQGDVGIGKKDAVVELHIVDGDSPTVRLEQDGSSGFTPQTWDIAGNEANFFVRDVTNGSQLPFKIKPGADSNSLFIAANNNIGIGTDSPSADATLHVRDATRAEIHLNDADGGEEMQLEKDNDVFNITFDASGDAELRIHRTGNVEVRRGALGLGEITAPTDTGGLNGAVLYIDSADDDLKVRFNNGTVVTLATN